MSKKRPDTAQHSYPNFGPSAGTVVLSGDANGPSNGNHVDTLSGPGAGVHVRALVPLDGTISLLSPTFDTIAATAMSIGASNATAVNIAKAGVKTSFGDLLVLPNVDPTVAGQVGMATATGRPRVFVGGVAQSVAVLSDIAAGVITLTGGVNGPSNANHVDTLAGPGGGTHVQATVPVDGQQGFLSATFDTIVAGTMTIGGVTTTAINIGHVGAQTTISGILHAAGIDTGGAGALSIGQTNATIVNLAKAGVKTVALDEFDFDTFFVSQPGAAHVPATGLWRVGNNAADPVTLIESITNDGLTPFVVLSTFTTPGVGSFGVVLGGPAFTPTAASPFFFATVSSGAFAVPGATGPGGGGFFISYNDGILALNLSEADRDVIQLGPPANSNALIVNSSFGDSSLNGLHEVNGTLVARWTVIPQPQGGVIQATQGTNHTQLTNTARTLGAAGNVTLLTIPISSPQAGGFYIMILARSRTGGDATDLVHQFFDVVLAKNLGGTVTVPATTNLCGAGGQGQLAGISVAYTPSATNVIVVVNQNGVAAGSNIDWRAIAWFMNN